MEYIGRDAKGEIEKIADLSRWLKVLLNKKSFSSKDLSTLNPQALLSIRLIRLLDREKSIQISTFS